MKLQNSLAIVVTILLVSTIGMAGFGNHYDPVQRDDVVKSRSNPRAIMGPEGKVFEPPFRSQFGEMATASFDYSFSLLSIYGETDWHDNTTTEQTGATSDTGATIKLSTGSHADGRVQLETVERAVYVPGSMMRTGVDVRASTGPDGLSGEQQYCAGAFDDNNGFALCADSDGHFIVIRDAGSDRTIRQDDWNHDTLDGDNDSSNPSGNDLDFTEGIIVHIIYNWYGHGDALWYVQIPSHDHERRERILLHQEKFENGTNVTDPNLPVTVEVDNNGTSSPSSFDVFLTGRQASILTGNADRESRPTNEFVSDVSITSSENTWVPLLACKEKDPFPPGTSRTNSVRVQSDRLEVDVEDGPAQFRVTRSDTASGTFNSPTNWGDNSAMECNKDAGNFTAETGNPFIREFVAAGTTGNSPAVSEDSERTVVLGTGQVFVVWVRKESATDITVSATFFMQEQW